MERKKIIFYDVNVSDIEEALRTHIMQQETDPRIREHLRTAIIALDWQLTSEGGLVDICLGVDGALLDEMNEKENPCAKIELGTHSKHDVKEKSATNTAHNKPNSTMDSKSAEEKSTIVLSHKDKT